MVSVSGARVGDRGEDATASKHEAQTAGDVRLGGHLPALDGLRGVAMKVMLQNLLIERFQLVMHRETKELAGYLLTVDPAGPKLREHDGGGAECVSSRSADGALRLQNCPLDIFIGYQLNGVVRGLVSDRTGLTGNYDFELLASWEVPANPAEGRSEPRVINPDAPSIFAA